ncbi:MBL fold metallo-hydrolase [Treponema bryantii]|uniref:MBL fold metallo-hydrolase n=1 Tax=Treponema bryantii TaxID=163 RepID=UPI0003B39565|nr:MBL fold metallo-hydrolase [Treponema bryantii]
MDNLTARIIELSSGVYVIPGTTNVGVVTNENLSSNGSSVDVYLIDSGSTEIDGEYVLDVLKAFFEQLGQTFNVKAIITTHGHPDHCGAHNFLKQETGCQLWAAKHEQGAMETPIIQGTVLWGGYPPHEMRTLFFMPSPTYLDHAIKADEIIELSGGRRLSFMELNGHSYQTFCAIISDKNDKKVIFPGDNIFPRNEIINHWIPLILNPVQYMESLDKLCAIEKVEWCIPSHGDFLKRNINEAAELNKIAIISTRTCILDSLKTKKRMTVEDIVKYVADKNDLQMTFSQYALVYSTVKSYIAVMHDAREIKMEVSDNKLYFSLPVQK